MHRSIADRRHCPSKMFTGSRPTRVFCHRGNECHLLIKPRRGNKEEAYRAGTLPPLWANSKVWFMSDHRIRRGQPIDIRDRRACSCGRYSRSPSWIIPRQACTPLDSSRRPPYPCSTLPMRRKPCREVVDDRRLVLAYHCDRRLSGLVGLVLASSPTSAVAYCRHHEPNPAAPEAAYPRGLPSLPPATGGSHAHTPNESPDHPLV
jgi:hypothetical protein